MNLISKKDLLAMTGISYGQLYRWKRERLIPEEWFIKQSAYTGQETFFPREQILSRIQSILELKDLYSLEELAKILSPQASVAKISIHDLQEMEEMDQGLILMLPEIYGKEQFEFFEVAFMIAVSQAVRKIGINEQQKRTLLENGISAVSEQKNMNVSCTFIMIQNEYHTVFSPNSIPIAFDNGIEVKDQQHLTEIADMIKIKYKKRFIK